MKRSIKCPIKTNEPQLRMIYGHQRISLSRYVWWQNKVKQIIV